MGSSPDQFARAAGSDERLDRAIAELEQLLTPVDEIHIWMGRVRGTLADASGAVATHVFLSEARGGFLDRVESDAPQLATDAARLRHEHDDLCRLIARLEADVEACELSDVIETRELRMEMLSVVRALLNHRHHGSDLLHHAYLTDYGGGD